MHPRTASSFTSWDGTRLAFRDFGNPRSPRALLFVNGLFCDEGYWTFLHRDLASEHRLVIFDHRGHGASDPPRDPDAVTVETLARDVATLADHLDLDRPVLVGFSLGVQVILEAWRQEPARWRALVAITGAFENPLGTFYGLKVPGPAARLLLGGTARYLPRAANLAWHAAFHLPGLHGVARVTGATRASARLMEPFYAHQRVVHVPTGLAMAAAATRHSARDVLPTIRVPTLVVAGGRDTFTPAALSRTMRDRIPGVEFLEVPEGTHTTLLEAPEVVNPRVAAFLDRVYAAEAAARAG